MDAKILRSDAGHPPLRLLGRANVCSPGLSRLNADMPPLLSLTHLGHGARFNEICPRAIDVFDATILRLWQPLPAEP
jgi:hypothetical protein